MVEFYVEICGQLEKIDSLAFKKLSREMLSLQNCDILSKIELNIKQINWEHGLLYDDERAIVYIEKPTTQSNSEFDCQSDVSHIQNHGRKRKLSDTEYPNRNHRKSTHYKNNMNTIFDELDSICNISNQHYL